MREIKKVAVFNHQQAGKLAVALDGQISNRAFAGFDPANITSIDRVEPVYIDTNTPLLRFNGTEQLNPELFLRSAPYFLVWIIRWLFLQDLLNRYYDFRLLLQP